MDLTEKIKERFSILPQLFDDIRIVDPLSKQVIIFDDENEKIKIQKGKCYNTLSKCNECENCVSYRSFIYNSTHTKIERGQDNKFVRIIATPIEIRKKTYIVEMIKEVNYKIAGIEIAQVNANTADIIEELNKKVVTDELTGVYNRRFIHERLDVDIFNQRKYNKSYIIVMADIDYFKSINDNYGHIAGDMVLYEIANLFKNILKNKAGWLGRYGGEEFVFAYYNKSLKEVLENVESARNAIATKEFMYKDNKINVTSSFGVAELDGTFTNRIEFLEFADKKLYKAKNNGRNRIEF